MQNDNIQLKTVGNKQFLSTFCDPKANKCPKISKKYPRIQFYEFLKSLTFPEQFKTFSDLPDDITHLSTVRNFLYNLLSKDPKGCEEFIKKQSFLEMIAYSFTPAILRLRHEKTKKRCPF